MDSDIVSQAVKNRKHEWIAFCQKLIQTPSPTYGEAEAAKLILSEMKRLEYDDVWIDPKGNVIGVIAGTDPCAPVINLNSHIDHVTVGDEKDWKYMPFSGHVEGDRIYGRGASDTKGAIAVQTYAPRILLDYGKRPRSTVYTTFVVEEELWGQGTLYLLVNSNLHFDLSILGEGTGNHIMLGHRGCIGIYVTIFGKSAHASMPEEGKNPNFDAARFILELKKIQKSLKLHRELGRTSMTPTIYSTGDISRNVIPEKVVIYIDCRQTVESRDDLVIILRNIADKLDIEAQIDVAEFDVGTEKISDGFTTPRSHPYVLQARNIIAEALNREVTLDYWRFCTDGRITARNGITTFGFSPCEEHLAHTVNDSVSIHLMEESLRCYPRLLMGMNSI
ncbi:M20 family metallopeptidase [Candidatus Latescibacterota bacterium]